MPLKQGLLLSVVMGTLIFSSAFATGNDITRVGRYLVEQNGPEAAQIDPLQEIFSLTFPSTIYSIRDAITYLLSNTGYNLTPIQYQSVNAKSVLKQRLPLSDRQMGPMTVEQGLLALAGNTYQLLTDPEHRLISFQLKKPYQPLYLNQVQSNRRW